MSIQRYEIASRVQSGELCQFPTEWHGKSISPVRALLLAKPMKQAIIDGPWPDQMHKDRLSVILRADLADFVSGKLMLTSLGGRDLVTEDLKRLQDVYEVWEFKSKDRRGIRVFGRFAGYDVFIATNWQWRDQLGSFGSDAFAEAIQMCTDTWAQLFSNHAPHTGENIHAYLSNAEDPRLTY